MNTDLVIRVVLDEDRIHISTRTGVVQMTVEQWSAASYAIWQDLEQQAAGRAAASGSVRRVLDHEPVRTDE
jgi:hypothetical protein